MEDFSTSFEETDDEVEGVCRLVELLSDEFQKNKGYSTRDGRALYLFWLNTVRNYQPWISSKNFSRGHKYDYHKTLTVETQKRLYDDKPWFYGDKNLSHLLKKFHTVEELQDFDPHDVAYTLKQFSRGNYFERRDKIRRAKKAHSRSRSKTAHSRSRSPHKHKSPKKQSKILIVDRSDFERMMPGTATGTYQELILRQSRAWQQEENGKMYTYQPQASNAITVSDDHKHRDGSKAGVSGDEENSQIDQALHLDLSGRSQYVRSLQHKPINLGSTFMSRVFQEYHKLRGYSIQENMQSLSSIMGMWHSKKFRNSCDYGKLYSLLDNDDIEFTLVKHMEHRVHEHEEHLRAKQEYFEKYKREKGSKQTKILEDSAFNFLCSRYEFKFQFVMRLIKAYMKKEDEPYSADTIFSFYKDHFKDFIENHSEKKVKIGRTNPNFYQRNPHFYSKYMNWVEGDEIRVKEAIDKCFKPKRIILRVALLFIYKVGYFPDFRRDHASIIFNFWNKLKDKSKQKFGVYYSDPETFRTALLEYMDMIFAERHKPKVDKFREMHKRMAAIVLKGKDIKGTGTNELAKPKSRWQLLHNLESLSKRFPLDQVLRMMIHEELKQTSLPQNANDFDVLDPKLEAKRKARSIKPQQDRHRPKNEHERKKMNEEAAFKRNERIQTEYQKIKTHTETAIKEARAKNSKLFEQTKPLLEAIKEAVFGYDKLRRESRKKISLTRYLGVTYSNLKKHYPQALQKIFPFRNYGCVSKEGEAKRTFAQAYPLKFKIYFCSAFKATLRNRGDLFTINKQPPNFWIRPSANVLNKTANIKALRQTMSVTRANLDVYDKIRPWRREDYYHMKTKIFMTEDEAKNCTFVPVAGTRQTRKVIDLAGRLFPEVAGQLEGHKPDFDKWVEKMRKNLSARDPTLFKTGIYKQAKIFYKQEQPNKAYYKLKEGFHIKSIYQHYTGKEQENVTKKNTGGIFDMVSGLLGKVGAIDEDSIIKPEKFERKDMQPLLKKVWQLLQDIQKKRNQVKKQIKMLEEQESNRGKNKTFMCALNEDCPDDCRPRWHKTGTKTISKFGKDCCFAHHPTELRFNAEVKAREKLRTQLLKKLKASVKDDRPRIPWRPASLIVECPGCGHAFSDKAEKRPGGTGGIKALCNACDLKKRAEAKTIRYLEAAKKTQARKAPAIKEKMIHTRKFDEKVVKKLGLFKKAQVLWNNKRIFAARAEIKQAFDYVKEERHQISENSIAKESRLRRSFSVYPQRPITASTQATRTLTPTKDPHSATMNAKISKHSGASSNAFMNQQIEELFSKIEMEVWRRKHSGDRLKESIQKVNNRTTEGITTNQFLLRPRKELMCPKILDGQKCTNPMCPYAHYVTQIDLVSERKYTKNCENAIKHVTMQHDKMKEEWHPPAVPYEFATRSMHVIANAEINQSMKQEKNVTNDNQTGQHGALTKQKEDLTGQHGASAKQQQSKEQKASPQDIQNQIIAAYTSSPQKTNTGGKGTEKNGTTGCKGTEKNGTTGGKGTEKNGASVNKQPGKSENNTKNQTEKKSTAAPNRQEEAKATGQKKAATTGKGPETAKATGQKKAATTSNRPETAKATDKNKAATSSRPETAKVTDKSKAATSNRPETAKVTDRTKAATSNRPEHAKTAVDKRPQTGTQAKKSQAEAVPTLQLSQKENKNVQSSKQETTQSRPATANQSAKPNGNEQRGATGNVATSNAATKSGELANHVSQVSQVVSKPNTSVGQSRVKHVTYSSTRELVPGMGHTPSETGSGSQHSSQCNATTLPRRRVQIGESTKPMVVKYHPSETVKIKPYRSSEYSK